MDPDESPGDQGSKETAGREDPGFLQVRDYLLYGLSLPERTLRGASGLVSGALRESAALLVPRAFRHSKTYHVFVQQMLDFMAEDVAGVDRPTEPGAPPKIENFVARKTVGNFIELAGMATVHLSPMMLLAIVSDIAYGSQAYLQELAEDLQKQGVIDESSTVHNVDDLLEAVAGAAETTATAFDTPPLSVEGLRQTVEQTRAAVRAIDPRKVMPQSEIRRLWNDIHSVAADQGVNPFAISSAMTLYSLDKVGQLGKGALSTVRAAGTLLDRHILDHYQEAIDDVRTKGIYGSLAQSSQPYVDALWRNFSRKRVTITEDLFTGRLIGRAWQALRGRLWRARERRRSTAAPAG